MSFADPIFFETFVALVALERSLHGMLPYMPLQITRISRSVVALVALEWLLPCVFPPNVNFQMTDCDA